MRIPILAVALGATAAATSANAQSGAQIPDFSGLWGRNSIDFEPPPSGPGPVMNKRPHPDRGLVGDTNPILRPEAGAKVKRLGDVVVAGQIFPDPVTQCLPEPTPYVWWQQEVQILQHRDKITILYVFDQQVRHVRMNAPHPAHVAPSWSGDSVGHYEGDTLVIDTIGIKVGPFAMVDHFGTPYSESLHVVEHIRLIDAATAKEAMARNERENGRIPPNGEGVSVDPDYAGMGLEVQFTVEDTGVFTMPWTAAVTYRRADSPWAERPCAESFGSIADGINNAVPTAAKPDF